MKFFYDFFPLLLFFAAVKVYDIYVATAVVIAASVVQVSWHRLRHGKFETMHLVTLGAVLVFGGLTLLLRDDTFIKWKPTVVYWIFAVLILGSQYIGQKTIIERLLSRQLELPGPVWRKINFSWGLFFLFAGALNIYVAFYYQLELDEAARTDFWVSFKVFGLTGLTFIFIILQAMYMSRYMVEKPDTD